MRSLFARLLALVAPVLLVCATTSAAQAAPERKTVLFFGDSLTFGYGLDDPAAQAYPALIQEKIDADGLPWRVVNAGLSGDTTSGGLRRIDWILRQPVDIFVLELGANDGLRGLPLDLIRKNLVAIVEKVRARNPDARVVLAGMRMPESMGDYAGRYDGIFPELATEHEWTLIPFLLDGVGGVPELNLADGIHPTAEGHRKVAETVWHHLRPLL